MSCIGLKIKHSTCSGALRFIHWRGRQIQNNFRSSLLHIHRSTLLGKCDLHELVRRFSEILLYCNRTRKYCCCWCMDFCFLQSYNACRLSLLGWFPDYRGKLRQIFNTIRTIFQMDFYSFTSSIYVMANYFSSFSKIRKSTKSNNWNWIMR